MNVFAIFVRYHYQQNFCRLKNQDVHLHMYSFAALNFQPDFQQTRLPWSKFGQCMGTLSC